MKRQKFKKAFTLVEIMIVVMIIALLALIAVPQMAANRRTAQRSGCMNNLRQINGAIQQYMLQNNTTTVPRRNRLRSMFQTGVFPTCPGNGTYTLPATDTGVPTCSLGASLAHRLSP
ncbi:MAG: prepilin-type N-terminal cleavage/methylation domain-containing protein [Kiritimatiellia bacterium]